jgi:hypothetical protein
MVELENYQSTVSLSDVSEYKGGELEFDFRNEDSNKKPNQ